MADAERLQVRTINDMDLDTLQYKKLDGKNIVSPAGDLSGTEHKET